MAALVGLAIACADFGLDQRQVRCEQDPSVCGSQQFCSSEGFCVVPRDAGGDDTPDASANCTGPADCEDDNPCTMDDCTVDGVCSYDPEIEATCGAGCSCEEGSPTELACGDGIDNDADDAPDCVDSDCPQCAGGLMCCPDGSCRPSC